MQGWDRRRPSHALGLPQAQTQDPLNRAYKWGGRVPDAGPIAPFALHDEAGAQAQPGQSHPPSRGQSEPGFSGRTGGRVPNWIAYDRKVSDSLSLSARAIWNPSL